MGMIKCIACQYDLNEFSPEHFNLIDLLLRGSNRHKDFSCNFQFVAGVSNALGVITGTGTHDPVCSFVGGQRFDLVIGTPDFVGSNHLQIFSFQQDICSVAFRKIAVFIKGVGTRISFSVCAAVIMSFKSGK